MSEIAKTPSESQPVPASWINVTPEALRAIHKVIDEENKPGAVLRVGVAGGGCSGLSYLFELDDKPIPEDDTKAVVEGITIVTDPKSFTYLIGMTLDYSGGLNGHGFEFKNPNATATCGCGSSFSV